MKMILGKKIGMSRVFDKTGKIIPVTLVLSGPCYVTQIKTKEKDGYNAVQMGFGKKNRLTKSERGHLDKIDKNFPNLRYLKELTIEKEEEIKKYKAGQKIVVSNFSEGERISIFGFSKGRGFAGVIKRHGFHGQPSTHGHKHDLRKAGSIGSTDLQRVRKGMKMAGHMGNEKVSIKNLEIVKIDEGNNLIALKGAVPGARNGLVMIKNQENKITK